jgi:hypothetical protein
MDPKNDILLFLEGTRKKEKLIEKKNVGIFTFG